MLRDGAYVAVTFPEPGCTTVDIRSNRQSRVNPPNAAATRY
jgi:hypothetical protein